MFVKYMVANFRCRCGDPAPSFDGASGTYRCARCGEEMILHQAPISTPASILMAAECSKVIGAYERRIAELEESLAEARAVGESERWQCEDFDAGHRASEEDNAIPEADDDRSELEARIEELEAALADAESTTRYFRGELSRAIDPWRMRDAVALFLDHVSALYNASFDKEDPEKLREAIRGRTEVLESRAESLGMHISHHERGAELGEGRVDIAIVPTGDRDMDGIVEKSMRFGCRFDQREISEIPEALRVYSFSDDGPVTGTVTVTMESSTGCEEVGEDGER